MMPAPEESFGSAARAVAPSSGVRDSARAGTAGSCADSFGLGVDASGLAGTIFISGGAISSHVTDAGGAIAV